MINHIITLSIVILLSNNLLKAQYISEVIEYKPAPSQLTNSLPWGVPSSATSIVGTTTGSMSLGAFGGYVIFKFTDPVKNDPNNPFGVDFTIFGNPMSDPANQNKVTWAEQGIVSVMKDENNNGLPDDTWYELAGSDYFFSSTIKNYSVTYTNPNQDVAADVPWVDNQGNSGFILKNDIHTQPYYPLADSFPAINSTNYTLSGTCIADEIYIPTPSNVISYAKAFGYVDNQIRGTAPYTLPDNPYTRQKENSGGDAFDISWAVNKNGEYIDLDEIDFIKVHNAVLANAGWLGEISTEITGAVDVEPNASISGVLDMVVIKSIPDTIKENEYQLEVSPFHEGRKTNDEIMWTSNSSNAVVDQNNILSFTASGNVTLTASLKNKSEISATVSTYLKYKNTSSVNLLSNNNSIFIYPNPASNFICISGTENAIISIFNIVGKKVLKIEDYSLGQSVSINNLPKGMYIVLIKRNQETKTLKFLKK
jgi:hypothetical protein